MIELENCVKLEIFDKGEWKKVHVEQLSVGDFYRLKNVNGEYIKNPMGGLVWVLLKDVVLVGEGIDNETSPEKSKDSILKPN